MAKQRILVTGATGSIGQHLVSLLLSRGDDVHVVTRSRGKIEAMPWGDAVTIHQIDLWDMEQVKKLYQEVSPNEIYHLAASVMQWGRNDSNEVLARANILSTVTLMDALEIVPSARFVYPGTFAELGGKPEPIREDHEPDPQEFYSISKLAGTLHAKQLARNKNYNIVVGRIFTAYGPGIPKERLVGQLLLRAQKNEEITLVHPEITRDFVYVTDIARAFMELGERAEEYRGEVFNVASGEKVSLLELFELIKEITNTKSNVIWQPERRTTYDALPWQADMTKTFSLLRWRPTVGLRSGLENTIESIK